MHTCGASASRVADGCRTAHVLSMDPIVLGEHHSRGRATINRTAIIRAICIYATRILRIYAIACNYVTNVALHIYISYCVAPTPNRSRLARSCGSSSGFVHLQFVIYVIRIRATLSRAFPRQMYEKDIDVKLPLRIIALERD